MVLLFSVKFMEINTGWYFTCPAILNENFKTKDEMKYVPILCGYMFL